MISRILALALALALAPIAALGQGQPPAGSLFTGLGAAQPKWLKPLDVWLLIGSSNTVGQGTSAQAPIPPSTALMYCVAGTVSPGVGVQPLTDPVCSSVSTSANWNANTGSLWPAFAIAYNRPVAIVQTAVSGSTQSTACDFGVGNGNWQATGGGSNYANSLTAINAALTAYTAAGYNPVFRGILQQELGVNDAAQIDAAVGGCTQAAYTAAFNAMAANYRSATIGGTVYPHLPIFMSLVPTNSNAALPEIPGYKQIRDAQMAIIAADGDTLLPYVGTISFGPRGLLQTNSVHPTQAGYNEWGYALGGAVLPLANANIPFKLFSANAAGPWLLPSNIGVLQLVQKDAFNFPLVMDTFAGVNGILMRSTLGTGAVPTNITNGTLIGSISMRGYGATGFLATNQAALNCNATQDYSDTQAGTSCSIFTTPNGSITGVRSLGLLNGNSAVFGPADAASPTAQTLSVQNVLTGTSNTAGANLTIAGSRGTGTGVGGSISLQVAPAGGAGSSQNTLVTEVTVAGNGNIGFGTETNPQLPFIFSSNATTGVNSGNSLNISALNGPWMVGATSSIIGWNLLSVATLGNNVFFRIDGTVSSPSNLGSAETIGTLNYQGWGNGARQSSAQINAITTEAWATTFGTQLQFLTTAVGGSRAQSMALKAGVIVGAGTTDPGAGALQASAGITSIGATSGVGYATGAGGAITQATSRTTGVTLNTVSGDITLVSAAGNSCAAGLTNALTFTVTNSAVAATDTISMSQKSGADVYGLLSATNMGAGSFKVTFCTTGGTTTEQPVFHFNVIKGVNSFLLERDLDPSNDNHPLGLAHAA